MSRLTVSPIRNVDVTFASTLRSDTPTLVPNPSFAATPGRPATREQVL
jgi:hypothetical protein